MACRDGVGSGGYFSIFDEGMGVVKETGMAGIFMRGQPPAGRIAALDTQSFQAGFSEIRMEDERVVPRAEDDAVVRFGGPGQADSWLKRREVDRVGVGPAAVFAAYLDADEPSRGGRDGQPPGELGLALAPPFHDRPTQGRRGG